MKHIDWLIDTKQTLQTADGKTINVFEFHHQQDDSVLSAWAKHFRNHYCLDSEIDSLRKGTSYSRAEYLKEIKFPDGKNKPGPSIRAGDFGEILVADYLQYVMNYWVPRTSYCDKVIRNESSKGCDIIGFKIFNKKRISPRDTLAVYEAKAKFSGNTPKNRLQDAVRGSMKDIRRKPESLNFIKQKLIQKGQLEHSTQVERFQDPEDKPYNEISGAVALFSTACFDAECVSETNASSHPNKSNLVLIVIHGEDMMPLVHRLYRRAADEA